MSAIGNAFGDGSLAVQAHLSILQSVINRMAANSASCKTWCITLTSAILVVAAEKGEPAYAFIAFVPVLLFLVLDTYYLSLEKRFRGAYNDFVVRCHGGEVEIADLYVVEPLGPVGASLVKSFLSIAVWPFYTALIVTVTVAMHLVTCR